MKGKSLRTCSRPRSAGRGHRRRSSSPAVEVHYEPMSGSQFTTGLLSSCNWSNVTKLVAVIQAYTRRCSPAHRQACRRAPASHTSTHRRAVEQIEVRRSSTQCHLDPCENQQESESNAPFLLPA